MPPARGDGPLVTPSVLCIDLDLKLNFCYSCLIAKAGSVFALLAEQWRLDLSPYSSKYGFSLDFKALVIFLLIVLERRWHPIYYCSRRSIDSDQVLRILLVMLIMKNDRFFNLSKSRHSRILQLLAGRGVYGFLMGLDSKDKISQLATSSSGDRLGILLPQATRGDFITEIEDPSLRKLVGG